MDLRRSRLTMHVALLALAGFLAFWLSQEYERSKKTITASTHLDVAMNVIGDQHQDLKGLLNEIDRLAKLNQGSSSWMDTSTNITIRARLEEQVKPRESFDVNYGHDSGAFMVFQYESGEELDSTFKSSRINYSWEEVDEDVLTRKALLSIWPQSVFALLLFGLFLVGIWVMQQNYVKEQTLIQEKNSLISNMTHELKTPVATISVALEAIQDFDVNSDQRKTDRYLTAARKELSRLSDSLEMVMDLSRIDQNSVIFEKKPIVLGQLFEEVFELIGPLLEHKRISVQLVGENEITVEGDINHLRNVMVNLVDNAIKYGRTEGHILVELGTKGDQALIAVKDNGIGIASKHQNMIFDRFFRVQHPNLHNVKGDGLGLSYVKSVVEAHEGTIVVSSEEGIGSRFEIRMPLYHGTD